MNPAVIAATATQAGVSAVKTGAKISVELARKSHDFLDRQYGDLPDRCRPEGVDFSKFETFPTRIRQNIELCREIADGIGMPEIHASLNEIIDQVSSPLYKIFIIGRYSTGKSSVLNALLDRDVLPAGTIPTTKVLTWLLAGDNESVVCEKQNGELATLPLSAVRDDSPDNQINQSRNIMILLNNELLNSGVALIDTPGLQDTDKSAIDTTIDAIESADALLFVVDTYMSAKEEEFLAELAKQGKTGNLFVIINKMDSVPEEERDEFIQERIDVLNKLGIAANIFPISARDRSMRHQVARLRSSLVDFMKNDIEKSRTSIIEGKVGLLMDVAHHTCQSAKEAQALSMERQAEAQTKIQSAIKAMTEKKYKVQRQGQSAVDKVENTILFNWQCFYRNLQGEIMSKIDKASVEDMKRRDFIESIVISRTFEFLNKEMEEARGALSKWTKDECHGELTPAIYDSFSLGNAKSAGLSAIPPQLVTAGLVIFSFSTGGLFSAVKLLVLTTIGEPLINNFFSSITGFVDVALMRRQLRSVLEEHWPQLDEQIRAQIKEMCNSFREQVNNSIDKQVALPMGEGTAILNVLEQCGQREALAPEKLDQWLIATERR